MNTFEQAVRGKHITVMGLGLLGRGIGDAAFLAQCGAEVLVTDRKSADELAESMAQLSHYPNITFHLGGHQEEDFTHTDMVLKAAGVPLDSPYIAAAKAAGVQVAMSTALFAKYAHDAGVTIVGVTGTRGKSTTTQMIYEVLRQYRHSIPSVPCACSPEHYADTGALACCERIFLGGNVRGVSTLALLPQMVAGDVAVLELDSWQLQGFGELGISPQVSVFTNLMPDHQNYYPNMEMYFDDKANIFKNQKEGDVLVCGAGVVERINAAQPQVAPHVPPALPADWKLQIPGEHNRENASLAAEALRSLKLPEEQIRAGLESFKGVEGRLQLVSDANGIKIYNDNNATTPEATIAALKALDTGHKNIVLIMGGADKGLDASNLLYEIAQTCKRVICLSGSGTTRVAPFMTDYSIFDSLDAACKEGFASAVSGDVILFSPAFASFGLFKNEYDRNDQFMKFVSSLQ